MSYLNPLLAFGLERLPEAAAQAGVCGFIIPDLPYEESADVRAALDRVGHRAGADGHAGDAGRRASQMLCEASQGFVYAVTMTGTTGKSVAVPDEVLDYMDRVRAVSPVPVCAGFGIRTAEQVRTHAGSRRWRRRRLGTGRSARARRRPGGVPARTPWTGRSLTG